MTRFLALIPVTAITIAAAAPSATQTLPPIATGATIGGIAVGGLNAESARSDVERAWSRPVFFVFDKKIWKANPHALGGRPQIERV